VCVTLRERGQWVERDRARRTHRVYVCVCMCLCVCERERESEKEREGERERERGRGRERERERAVGGERPRASHPLPRAPPACLLRLGVCVVAFGI
jgi:hypothetical protein